MEITIFIVTIIGFIIAYLTYKKEHVDAPNEKAKSLSQKYQFAERSTKELINELEEYISINNAMDEHFMQGLTFSQSLIFLKSAYNELFSEDISQALIKYPSLANSDLQLSLENHIKHVQEIRTVFKFYIKKDFNA